MSREFIKVGETTALVCDDGSAVEALKSTLEELGFKCHTAETPERAIERMRYTPYNVIALGETFGGSTLETNAVLRYLTPLPMEQRRNWFVFIVGDSLRTLDAMQAYARSVHLVVHPTDLANLGPILKKGLAEFETFYVAFRGVLAETGEIG